MFKKTITLKKKLKKINKKKISYYNLPDCLIENIMWNPQPYLKRGSFILQAKTLSIRKKFTLGPVLSKVKLKSVCCTNYYEFIIKAFFYFLFFII